MPEEKTEILFFETPPPSEFLKIKMNNCFFRFTKHLTPCGVSLCPVLENRDIGLYSNSFFGRSMKKSNGGLSCRLRLFEVVQTIFKPPQTTSNHFQTTSIPFQTTSNFQSRQNEEIFTKPIHARRYLPGGCPKWSGRRRQ